MTRVFVLEFRYRSGEKIFLLPCAGRRESETYDMFNLFDFTIWIRCKVMQSKNFIVTQRQSQRE